MRNVADLRTRYEFVHEDGKFRVVKMDSPYFDGFEYWVINNKGFLWEPAETLEAALAYLTSDEARDYNAE